VAIRRLKTPERDLPKTFRWRYDCGDDKEGSQEARGEEDGQEFCQEASGQEDGEKDVCQGQQIGLQVLLASANSTGKDTVDYDEKEPPGRVAPAALSIFAAISCVNCYASSLEVGPPPAGCVKIVKVGMAGCARRRSARFFTRL
jgi:hypothetical protein